MKKLLSIALCLAFTGLAVADEFAVDLPEKNPQAEVGINFGNVHIPSGFDNAAPIAIVSGYYPNGCYSWDRAEVTHPRADEEQNIPENLHEVRAMAKVGQGLCIMVLVPYSKEIEIGTLTPGEHTLRFVNGDGTHFDKKLTIE